MALAEEDACWLSTVIKRVERLASCWKMSARAFAVASAAGGGTDGCSLSSSPGISNTKLIRSGILPRLRKA